ncbi:MAG: hypothetical protein ACLUL2_09305 [Blautia sp.]
MNKTASFLVTAEDYEKNGKSIEAAILNILDDYKDLDLQTLREKKIDDAAQTKKDQYTGFRPDHFYHHLQYF